MRLLVVIAMSQYVRAELIEEAPRFICSFNPGNYNGVINCCTPMDLDGDGRINDILFSCLSPFVIGQQLDYYYMYAEILRRNETWCKKTWNQVFDNGTFELLRNYKPLDAC